MKFIRDNWLILLIILVLIYLFGDNLRSKFTGGNRGGIPFEVQLQLDSLKDAVYELDKRNVVFKTENDELNRQITLLESQLSSVKAQFVKTIREYNSSTPDEKNKLISIEFEKRKLERDTEK